MLYGDGNMEASGEKRKKTLDIIHKKPCIKTA